MNKSRLILAAVAASNVILAGCGGGGGGSTAPAAPTTPTTTPPASTATSTINPVVSTPNYPTGSNQALVYSMLNAARVRCGFGSVSQSTPLDQAALAHSRWMLLNNMGGHYESTTSPNGFTGVSPQDRGVAAGYVYSTNAGLESGESQSGVSGQVAYSAIAMLTGLLASPYHEVDLMRGWIHMGIGYMDSTAAGTTAMGVSTAKPYAQAMKKPSKPKNPNPFLTLLGEDVYYQLLADAPDRPDPAGLEIFATNPLLEMDTILCGWEHGLMTLPEFLESVGDVTSSGLETIARGGHNTSWKFFEMFDGQFRSREGSVIGAILRQMHAQADMKLWAPFLKAIDAAVASGQLPAIDGEQSGG